MNVHENTQIDNQTENATPVASDENSQVQPVSGEVEVMNTEAQKQDDQAADDVTFALPNTNEIEIDAKQSEIETKVKPKKEPFKTPKGTKPNPSKTEQNKVVDLSPLHHFKEALAANHLKEDEQRPGQFSKHMPELKKKKIFVPKVDEDGVTHINVAYNAKTKFGQLLDMYSYSPFTTEELGSFNCVGGMKHFLMSEPTDRRFRTLAGRTCHEEAKKITDKVVPNLQLSLADGTWFKITQNDFLMNEMVKSDLPFYSYFLRNGVVVETGLGTWYTAVLTEIRRVIKLNTQNIKEHQEKGLDIKDLVLVYPDFSFLDRSKSN